MTIAEVVLSTPPHTIEARSALAIPAPKRPPIRAWELLDGMPAHQVIRFQEIAPINAAKMILGVTILGSMMPVPIVWATCSPKNRKAMKLKNAAHNTAARGGRTRVETMVAIEFAASCRPLRKSNTNATATSPNKSPRVAASMRVLRWSRRAR
jgi:hypothetical protein